MLRRPIGDIGENESCNLLLFRAEEFFTFTKDPINGLRRAGIQAKSTGFHAPRGIEFIGRG